MIKMEKNVKILLITCVILVAILSLTLGILIGNKDSANPSLNTTNNTTLTVNATNNTNTKSDVNNNATSTQSNQNKLIGTSKAIAIANKYVSKDGQVATGNVDFLSGIEMYQGRTGHPFYHVDLKWKSGYSQPYDAGYIEIDAITGKVNPRG